VPKGIPLWTFVFEVLACSPTAFAGNIHSAPGIQEIEPGKDAMPEVATPSRLEVKNSDYRALFQAADRVRLRRNASIYFLPAPFFSAWSSQPAWGHCRT
jgi:hypothetical protein